MGDKNDQANLIVNYLPQTLTNEEFRSMFLSIGPLKSAKVIRDRATNYSYGFGFVEYVNEADAERAIETLNGLSLQSKTLKVAYARKGENIKGANLYVRNIPRQMSEENLKQMFGEFGDIIQCRILKDKYTALSKGVGFVLFDQKDHADEAMGALDGYTPEGATEALSVKYAEDNRGKARQPAPGATNSGGFTGGYSGGPSGGPGGYVGRGGGGSGPARGFPGRGGYDAGGYGNAPRPGPMRNQGPGGRHRYNPVGNSYAGSGGYSGNGGGYGSTNNIVPQNSTAASSEEGYILFAYNIGTDADERTLWQLFSPHGAVQKVNIIRDFQKDQCKGYGFVTMTNYHEAMAAIQTLNGQPYNGRKLQVSFKSAKK